MLYSDKEKIITDVTPHKARVYRDKELGTRKKGLVPRDWKKYPLGTYAGEKAYHAVEMTTFNPADFPGMIKEIEESGSRLSDFRMKRGKDGAPIPSTDQNGRGYCWIHSGCSALLIVRARDNMPFVDLSAYAGACMIKNYRDEGGWGAQGLDWIMEKGLPSSEFWPQRSVSRSNDKPETWENAKLHRFTEGWIDTSQAQYDRNLTFNQMITCLLCRIPVITDFNWWGHSVCAVDAVNGKSQWGVTRASTGKLMTKSEFDAFWGINNPVTAGIAIRIWNSWSNSWGEQGMGLLTGNKAVPDGATAPRVATFSVN
jgi:hypothetical protein